MTPRAATTPGSLLDVEIVAAVTDPTGRLYALLAEMIDQHATSLYIHERSLFTGPTADEPAGGPGWRYLLRVPDKGEDGLAALPDRGETPDPLPLILSAVPDPDRTLIALGAGCVIDIALEAVIGPNWHRFMLTYVRSASRPDGEMEIKHHSQEGAGAPVSPWWSPLGRTDRRAIRL